MPHTGNAISFSLVTVAPTAQIATYIKFVEQIIMSIIGSPYAVHV